MAEKVNNNPTQTDTVEPQVAQTEPAVTTTPIITPTFQEATSPSPTSLEPVQTPPTAPEAPKTETTSESTNIPASSLSGEAVPESVVDSIPVQPEPVKNEPVISDENGPIETTSPAYAQSSGEAKPATEISTPHQNSEIPNLGGQAVDQNTAHTTPSTPKQNSESVENSLDTVGQTPEPIIETPPHQNLEIPNLGGQEAELLAAEIAQRKLLKSSNRFMAWLRAKALVTRQRLIRKKLDKIMTLFNQHEKITNELIGKNLHIPHRTVSRYLDTLEKEGKIKQVGAGRNIFYVKV